MSPTETRVPYITPPNILISSQAILLNQPSEIFNRFFSWNIKDYLNYVASLGVGLMYEPNRRTLSPARRQLEGSPDLGNGIGMIAEPARTETHLRDYELRTRGLFQLLYAALQQARFSDETIAFLKLLQRAISSPENPVAVRVYPPSEHPSIKSASILNRDISPKIYAQDHGLALAKVAGQMRGMKDQEIIDRIVNEIVTDVDKYDVDGIELNILGLMIALHKYPHLIFGVIESLLAASTPNREDLALVQSLTVQPNRIDLPSFVKLEQMKEILRAVADQGYAGSIIYNPGHESDMNAEIAELIQTFNHV